VGLVGRAVVPKRCPSHGLFAISSSIVAPIAAKVAVDHLGDF
jgi:hypothetical protein